MGRVVYTLSGHGIDTDTGEIVEQSETGGDE